MKPTIKKGQEWEKTSGSGGWIVTRIRIVSGPDGCANPACLVQSALGGEGNTQWGRLRRLMCSALSNTPKGYRLVKETS